MKRIRYYRILSLDETDGHKKQYGHWIKEFIFTKSEGYWKVIYIPKKRRFGYEWLMNQFQFCFMDNECHKGFKSKQVTQKELGWVKGIPKAEYEKQYYKDNKPGYAKRSKEQWERTRKEIELCKV